MLRDLIKIAAGLGTRWVRYADTAAPQYNNVSPPLRKRLNAAKIFALLVMYGSPVNATALNERLT
jgi:hypothetical protein